MTIKKTLATLVMAAMLATLIAFTSTRSNASGGGSTASSLEGSWEITVMPDGGSPIIDLATFTDGGGIINTDPDPNLSTGHGTWSKTEGHKFVVTFVHFLTNQGTSLGTVKVRAEIRLDRQTDTFSGPFHTEVLIGGNLVQSFCGTVEGRRIGVQAPECP
ncbi:MAG TPA: hypothetical protein VIB00_01860 [Pyrinomonadaceae bacterium]